MAILGACLLAAAGLALITVARPTYAQELPKPPPPANPRVDADGAAAHSELDAADESASAAALTTELAALDAELERLRKRRTAAEEQLEQVVADDAARQRSLAEQIVAAHRQRQIEEGEVRELRRSIAEGRRVLEPLTAGLERLDARARDLREALAIALRELPCGEFLDTEFSSSVPSGIEPAGAAGAVNPAAGTTRAEVTKEVLTAAVKRFESFLRIDASARSTRVEARTIRTARGTLEPVRLLRVGHVSAAYLTASGVAGLALAAPTEAKGFRWCENLAPDLAEAVIEAVGAVERAPSEPTASRRTVRLPVDVTGTLQCDAIGRPESWLDFVRSGGLVMLPLLAVAILAVLLLGERAWYLLRNGARADTLAQSTLSAVRAGDHGAARDLCQRARGVTARTLASCLAHAPRGQRAMEDAIQEQLLHELPALQRSFGGISVLGATAPLLGLLGTVTGIIQTFGALRVPGTPNAGLMAGGIAEALVTTAAGLVIAIPILLLNSALSGRSDRTLADAERHAATLLNTVLSHAPPAHERHDAHAQHDAQHDDDRRGTR
ncbi:MAG: MotA/TolQ/ExbB proton channel family protein [Planctomycetota bacterium]